MKTLTLDDFLAYVPVSKNLPLKDLKPYIERALLMDVTPMLGELAGRLLLADAPEDTPFTAEEVQARKCIDAVWVHNAFIRFLPIHGIAIDAAGLTKTRDSQGAAEHASPQERQALIASYRSSLNYWEGELGKALKKLNGTGRPVKKRRIGLRVVGGKN
ncbi:hypothetical protein [Pontibacter burrus]|uniref:Uncharacterized protein n=1 Tax=Pontibacter burrus TaxID=2704466 RepID=A0A6B3LRM9_9BACT|nr:hypothetical protein [Pontibacter burrus]NEM96151.1 hypothetical protein [Pontibacter burrus]